MTSSTASVAEVGMRPRQGEAAAMAEAGHPDGSPSKWSRRRPTFARRADRSRLQAIGIRSRLQVMERAVFQKKMMGGQKEWPGVQIIFNATRIGGTWSSWYDTIFKCGGYHARDFFCVKELDDKFESTWLRRPERTQAARGAGAAGNPGELLSGAGVPPRSNAYRSAHRGQAMARSVPTLTTGYCYPWEDIKLA